MSSIPCTFSELLHPSGYRMLRLANGILGITVLPEKGAEIYALEYLPRNLDILWKSPWGLRKSVGGAIAAASGSEMAWMDHYIGGWQGIFPNAGEPCEYRGGYHNFHGEASLVPWNYTVAHNSPSRLTVIFETVLVRSPFSLRREITLEQGSGVLHIEETIKNESPEAFPCIWGHHPALGAPFLSADCRIQLPATTFQREGGQAVSWKGSGLAVVPGPEARVAEFGYLSGFEAGWYAIHNQKLQLNFALAWPLEVFPCAWLWQELHGTPQYPWFQRAYVMAIEPYTTPSCQGLAHAAKAGIAAEVPAGASRTVQLAASLWEGTQPVKKFSPSGKMDLLASNSPAV